MTKRVTQLFSNSWLLDTGEHRFLIDTGHSAERPVLLANLLRHGVRGPGDLRAILLTHRHSDHAGNAAWLRKFFKIPLICHEQDAAILRGDKPACRLLRAETPLRKRPFCSTEDRFPSFCEIDDVYSEGAWKWGLAIVPTPGHTEGSVMIYHAKSQTLFSGDSIIVGYPFARKSKKLRFADPDFCVDYPVVLRSTQRFLKELPPTELLCSGHGPAVDEQAFQKLKKLLR